MTITDLAFDSNVLTFFLDANRGEYELSAQDPLREERITAYRLFLHCRPFIVRTVTAEAERIKNDAKLKEHMSFIWNQFAECVPDDAQIAAIERRASELEPHHPGGLNDCRIVAEVENCGVSS
jgi:hypothetical protein